MSLAVDRRVSKILNDIRRIRLDFFIDYPRLLRLVVTRPVIVSEDVETAGVTPSGELIVNPGFWESLEYDDKKFVLLHEVLHSALAHHERFADLDERNRMLWNIATDAVINDALVKLFPRARIGSQVVTTEKVYEFLKSINPDVARRVNLSKLKKMNEEQLYHLLVSAVRRAEAMMRAGEGSKRGRGEGLLGRGGADIDEEIRRHAEKTVERGEMVATPQRELGRVEPEVGESRMGEGVRDARGYVESAIRESLKQAGTSPGDIAELVDRLRPRGRIDWSNYLVSLASDVIFGEVVYTFSRPSRRFESMPGYKWITRPAVNAVFLIDVSGSIDTETLRSFLEETLHAKSVLGDALKGYVITWDVGVRNIVSIDDLAREGRITVTGRGGTVIDDALRKVLEMSESEQIDLVVVLTDGLLELNDPSLPSEVLKNVGMGLIVYTATEPGGFEGWKKIAYEYA